MTVNLQVKDFTYFHKINYHIKVFGANVKKKKKATHIKPSS